MKNINKIRVPTQNTLNYNENVMLFEILNYITNYKPRFFKRTSPSLRLLMKQVNMKKHKVNNLDKKTIQEALIYLNSKSTQRIYIQSYLLLLEWEILESNNTSKLDELFKSIGELKIESLKTMADKYDAGEINLDQLFSQDDSKKLEKAIKPMALKLFEKFKKVKSSKIDEARINKLNKGALKNVWSHVVKNLEIIKTPGIPNHIKAIAIGALIYVMVPVDAVPDFIPIGGLVDDAAVITLAIEQIRQYLNKNKY